MRDKRSLQSVTFPQGSANSGGFNLSQQRRQLESASSVFLQWRFRNQFLTQVSRLISLDWKSVVNGGEFDDEQFFEVHGTVPGLKA